MITDKDKKLVTSILDKVDLSLSYKEGLNDKLIRFYKLYHNYTPEKEEGESNLFIPYTFRSIESQLPKLINSIFGSNPVIGYIPQNANSVEATKNMELLVDFQLNYKINFVTLAINWLKELLQFGTSILYVTWRHEIRRVKKRVPVLDEVLGLPIGYDVVEVDDVVYDAPWIEHIDFMDGFFYDPDGTTIDNCDYCGHITYVSKKQFERLAKQHGFKNANIIMEGTGGDYTKRRKEERLAVQGLTSNIKKDDLIELIHYWENDRHVVIAERTIPLLEEKNPYWHGKKPYISVVDYPQPHQFNGKGEIEPIESLQHELNDIRNQRMDNINIAIKRVFKKLKMADIDPEQLKIKGGQVIEVDNMDDIEVLNIPDVTQSSYKEEAVLKEDIDETLGLLPYNVGELPSRRETATTASILAKAGNERTELKIKLIATAINELGEMLKWLNWQFVTSPVIIPQTTNKGVEFIEIAPEKLQGDMYVRAACSVIEPVASKEVRQQQFLQMLQIVSTTPMFMQLLDPVLLLKRLFEVYDIRDGEKLIRQQSMFDPNKIMQLLGGIQNGKPGSPPNQIGGLENIGEMG